MKNTPQRIYLVINTENNPPEDFNEMHEVTWCREKVFDESIAYDRSHLDQVADFHRTFQHPILKTPTIPDQARCDLRVRLLQEELDELKKAIADGDLVEVADALCDIQYVLSGAVLEFGMGDKFLELFAEVQRSNMSKADKTRFEAIHTILDYRKKGVEAYYKEHEGVYLIYRKSDNKTLKSSGYSAAELERILKS